MFMFFSAQPSRMAVEMYKKKGEAVNKRYRGAGQTGELSHPQRVEQQSVPRQAHGQRGHQKRAVETDVGGRSGCSERSVPARQNS